MRQLKIGFIFCFAVLLSACGIRDGGSSGDSTDDGFMESTAGYVTPAGVEECSIEDIKRRVDYDMRDYYIYYDSVPQLNQADYETPSEYIRALRVEPDIYSSVGDAGTQSSFFEEGEREGYGYWLQRASDNTVRFRQVVPGSSVHAAGVLRGDRILAINGMAYDDVSDEEFDAAFARETGNVATVTVQTGNNEPRDVLFTYGVYRFISAGPAKLFGSTTNPALPTVGYLPVASFLETTRAEMHEAFAQMRSRGEIDELILDLRYNGGGRISVANELASVIGGELVENQLSSLYRYNDKYTQNNFFFAFDEVEFPLNLSRLIVLTTGNSASSSEIVINSLQAYIDVVVIGQKTEGKAFISSAAEYCGKAINAMSAIGVNDNDVSVVGGIEPSCEVSDDWLVPANDSDDPLLGAALSYTLNSSCGLELLANSSDQLRSADRSNSALSGDASIRTDLPMQLFVDE